jgi:hypothetical protein
MRAFPSTLLLVCAVAVIAPAAAHAQDTPGRPLFGVQKDDPAAPAVAVSLDYAAVEGCPTEKELRDIVASRMGYDPFTLPTAPAPLSLRIAIVRQGGGFAGALELRDTSGRVLWARPPLAETDCHRLAGVIGGVTVTIAIDTASSQTAAAPLPPPEPAPLAPPLPQPPAEPPPSTPVPRPVVPLGVRAAAAVGVGPAPTAAISADLGAGWPFFSIAVEGRADVPTTGGVSMGVSAWTSVLAASLVPCGHYRWFVGCAVLSAGVLQAKGADVLQPAQDSGIYAAAGVRAGLEWPVVPAFALRLSADALVNLHPLAAQVAFENGRAEVWRSGPFAAMIGGGAVARFGGP